MVGSAITRYLTNRGGEVLKVGRDIVDLRDQLGVEVWLKQNRPEVIVFAAAKVGGIYANDTFPADFIYDNLTIEASIIHSAHVAGVDRLVFLGLPVSIPNLRRSPSKEEALLTGPLEPTNECYAIAKIAGIKRCQAYRKQYGRRYISVMPCNLYGPAITSISLTSHLLLRSSAGFTRSWSGGRGTRCASTCMLMISLGPSYSISIGMTIMNISIAGPGARFR